MIAYMREEDVFVTVTFAVVFVVVGYFLLEYFIKRQRLQVIQRAMESRDLDDLSRRSILDVLASDAERHRKLRAEALRVAGVVAKRVLFIVGWLTLVIGGTALGGMLAFGSPNRYDLFGATIAIGVGFALVSLPLAMRELDARRA